MAPQGVDEVDMAPPFFRGLLEDWVERWRALRSLRFQASRLCQRRVFDNITMTS